MQNLYFTELLIFCIRFQFPGHKGDFAQPEPDPNIYVVNLMGNLITFSSIQSRFLLLYIDVERWINNRPAFPSLFNHSPGTGP